MNQEEYRVEFIYESIDKENIKCNKNEKLINIFRDFAKKRGIDLNSLYFLCNANKIDDYEQTFDQLANKVNKENMEIKILVYNANEENFSVYFLEPNNARKYIVDKNSIIKDICDKYESDSNFRHNSKIYKYKDIELDLNKTFADYDTSKNDIFIKVYSKELLYIIFAYLGILYSIECYKEDKIEDICTDFASKNNIDKNKVMFKYKDISVNPKQTLNEFLQEKNININNIKIDVIDSNIAPSFWSIHKIKLIVALSITVVVVTAFVITYYLVFKKKKIYIIKTVFCLSEKGNKTVKLMSDEFNINRIEKMTIDDKMMKPTRTFTFNEFGFHNVTFFFYPTNDDIDINESFIHEMFSGCFSFCAVYYDKIRTENISNYEGIFDNYSNLTMNDISSFTHNNLSDSNLSIFNNKITFN